MESPGINSKLEERREIGMPIWVGVGIVIALIAVLIGLRRRKAQSSEN